MIEAVISLSFSDISIVLSTANETALNKQDPSALIIFLTGMN
jgi:hypothetical protein